MSSTYRYFVYMILGWALTLLGIGVSHLSESRSLIYLGGIFGGLGLAWFIKCIFLGIEEERDKDFRRRTNGNETK